MAKAERLYTVAMPAPLLTTPLLAFLLAVLLHVLALRLFPRWKLLDFPERYGLIRPRLPYPTGILSAGLFLILLPFIQVIDRQTLGLIAAVALLAATSFIDDRRPLPALLRLAVQGLAALAIVATGDCTGSRICSVTNPLEGIAGGPVIDLNGFSPILTFGATIVWLLLTINALNWFDGIAGQVSVISFIAYLIIGFLSLSARVGQPHLALLAFSLAGIAGGGLLFDFPPPRVLIGDTGSMFFGLMIGTLTIFSGGKVATAFLVLGIPIIDFVFVTIRRIAAGRSPFRGSPSGEHLHHRLLETGWRPRSIIALTAGIGACFGIAALFFDTRAKALSSLALVLLMLLLEHRSKRHPASTGARAPSGHSGPRTVPQE